jgi:hypothetical protein
MAEGKGKKKKKKERLAAELLSESTPFVVLRSTSWSYDPITLHALGSDLCIQMRRTNLIEKE